MYYHVAPSDDADERPTAYYVETEERYAAHNYRPLDVVIASAEGAWVTDVDGSATSTCSPRTRRSTSATGTRP